MYRGSCLILAAFLIAFGVWSDAAAQDRPALLLPSIFDNDMVVQRDSSIRIWGWAAPGSPIRVTMSGESAEATSAEDSTWMVTLPPLDAGGPYAIHVEGPDTLSIENVLVGDVWIASGQSNMEWPLSATTGSQAAIAEAADPHIRLLRVEHALAEHRLEDFRSSGWHERTPETAGDFSAVAQYFAAELQRELDVPIGLIQSAWGGTVAEAWMSAEGLLELPDFSAIAESLSTGLLTLDMLEERRARMVAHGLREWSDEARRADEGYSGVRPVWSDVRYVPTNWDTINLPGAWEDAGLQDFDGIVWFRRSFELPAAWSGDSLLLSLGTIDDMDDTWVNGVRIGAGREFGERRYVVPPEHLRAGSNVLVVRVIDRGGPGGIQGEQDNLYVEMPGSAERITLAGSWLYRPGLDFARFPGPPWFGGAENNPAVLFNAMIAPMTRFPVKGVIWYQGESNAGRAYQYRNLFPALIKDWRVQFANEEMPFLFVQLANYMAEQRDPNEESAWAELREAQAMALTVPNTEMAVTIDIGDANDIHPRNKADVGKRLALAARAKVYGHKVPYAGPRFVGTRRDGNTIRLLFSHVGSGLVARGGKLAGFAIAGPDGIFVWADARIEGNMVVVSSPAISDPRAVRYGWANNPPVNLFNREGLPAAPFRTDDMPGLTQTAR